MLIFNSLTELLGVRSRQQDACTECEQGLAGLGYLCIMLKNINDGAIVEEFCRCMQRTNAQMCPITDSTTRQGSLIIVVEVYDYRALCGLVAEYMCYILHNFFSSSVPTTADAILSKETAMCDLSYAPSLYEKFKNHSNCLLKSEAFFLSLVGFHRIAMVRRERSREWSVCSTPLAICYADVIKTKGSAMLSGQ